MSKPNAGRPTSDNPMGAIRSGLLCNLPLLQKAALETVWGAMNGARSINDACVRLGVTRSAFDRMRGLPEIRERYPEIEQWCDALKK